MKALLCELILSCLIAAPGAKSIDELTYGTALYAYYQEDHQEALLNVMVAEAQARRGGDTARFDLAKGSFAFKSRMYGLASRTFASVSPDDLSDMDRARLAFHMARERHRRQDWPGLEENLARIPADLLRGGGRKSHAEVAFMTAEAGIARGDLDAAWAALEAVQPGNVHLAYGLFNLGVAARSAGDLPRARMAFARLADLPYSDPESRDIVQRGRLAMAVMDRQAGRTLDADGVLRHLPGAGRYRDQALAAYAGLAMDNGDHELAARIWLTLQRDNRWNVSTAAARLGYPMSLEALAAPQQALAHYREAEQNFATRLAALQRVAGNLQDEFWVSRMLGNLAENGPTPLADWNDALSPEDWLEWLAAEDVHSVLLEWRELKQMASWLDDLPERLSADEEVAREQRRRTAEAGRMIHEQDLRGRRNVLAAQVDALAADLDMLRAAPPAFTSQWMNGLATPEERALLEELAGMESVLDRLPPAQQRLWAQRVQRLRGRLFWELADARSGRIRTLENALRENRDLLAAADERIARLVGAEGVFARGVEADFARFTGRAERLRDRVDDARVEREALLAAALGRGIQREARAVEGYLLTARIAIARTTDQLASREPMAEPVGGS